MPPLPPQEMTRLLAAWSDGDKSALDRLFPLVEAELHRLAHHYMNRERPDHTLQTTALVNEAYLRLIDQRDVQWQNRAHFFGIAAQIMRRILIDHARRYTYAKRGDDARKVSLEEAAALTEEKAAELVALDEALSSLAEVDERKSIAAPKSTDLCSARRQRSGAAMAGKSLSGTDSGGGLDQERYSL